MSQLLFKKLSYQIIGAAYTVHSKLGPGLLEVLYKRAMCIELRKRNINYACEAPFDVPYDTEIIGAYKADFLVEGKIIVEIKSVKSLSEFMEAKLINYLGIAKLQVGYLINFNSITLVWKRFYRRL
jgi:GxxExxY protein